MEQTYTVSGKPFTPLPQELELCRSMNIPPSNICPEERMRICMAERNEWKRYHRKCDKTGASIISAYPAESPYVIYKNDVWWGDSWDAAEYAHEFDFSRPFFDQFIDLQRVVPREGTSIFQSENCDFNSHIRFSRNCYLNSLVANCEDVYYSYWMVRGKNCFDCVETNDCTLCCECIDTNNCYGCVALQDSSNCSDCLFSYQLTGCRNCLFCSNLANKTYCIRNKPCTKEEFEEAKHAVLNGSWTDWLRANDEWTDIQAQSLHRPTHMLNCENVTGDHIYNSRNCVECYESTNGEDCFYCVSLGDSKNICSGYSIGWPGSELVYFCSMTRGCTDVAYCTYVWFSSNLRYCDSCQTCKNCFGCVGLRQKQYCILNKQFTKEEYDALLPRIITHMKTSGEWGEFFPSSSFPYAYNETAAQDRMPLTKQEALKLGFRWSDREEEPPVVQKTIAADKLPDSLNQVADEILQWAIQSKSNGRPFRIIKQELDFYRLMGLPIPRLHPTERHLQRMARRNPPRLWGRKCAKCSKQIESSYPPERKEVVYCENCYLQSIY